MKFSKFVIECNKNYMDPNIALENSLMIKALKDRDDKKVIELLHNDF